MVGKFFDQGKAAGHTFGTVVRGCLFLSLVVLSPGEGLALPEVEQCRPTSPDALGPFYKAGAPVRSRVGEGYVLRGVVRSSADCRPIAGARIEFWLAGPEAVYDEDHRATVYSDGTGSYRFESNFPPAYAGRPPHVHLRVSAEGYRTLVTQHYPTGGDKEARFDLVLAPTP